MKTILIDLAFKLVVVLVPEEGAHRTGDEEGRRDIEKWTPFADDVREPGGGMRVLLLRSLLHNKRVCSTLRIGSARTERGVVLQVLPARPDDGFALSLAQPKRVTCRTGVESFTCNVPDRDVDALPRRIFPPRGVCNGMGHL
jgi:hypothetical protein